MSVSPPTRSVHTNKSGSEHRFYRYFAMHPISNATQIGATLESRRKHLELTQTEVAEKLSLSQNRLSEVEADPGTLTVEQLLALTNVLGSSRCER